MIAGITGYIINPYYIFFIGLGITVISATAGLFWLCLSDEQQPEDKKLESEKGKKCIKI